MSTFIKEHYLTIGKYGIYLAGICELALSNLVISSINIVRSQTVGVYYFAYILFGLLIIFSAMRMSEKIFSKLLVLALGALTVFSGFLTYREILVTFVDRMEIVRLGLNSILFGGIFLVFGLAVVLINTIAGFVNAKQTQ